VTNVASLVARFLFEPLEDQCFSIFSRMNVDASDSTLEPSVRNSASAKAKKTLTLALKVVATVAVPLALIGPHYSHTFFRLLYGSLWADETSAPLLLSLYFVYLLFMAINGVLEAFFNAVATGLQLQTYGQVSALLSAFYIVLASVLTLVSGPAGLIVANCANMSVRILYCAQKALGAQILTIHSPTQPQQLLIGQSLPRKETILSASIGSLLCLLSRRVLIGRPSFAGFGLVLHVSAGALALATFLITIWRFDRPFVRDIRNVTRGKIS